MLQDPLTAEREHCLRMIRAHGVSVHAYYLRKADKLEAGDRAYAGLVAAVEAEIGHVPVIAARRAAKWMESA